MPNLNELIPDPELLVSLDPEELGGLLLQVLATRSGQFHPGNFEGELFDQRPPAYPAAYRTPVLQAVREAFAWLESQVLIIPSDAQAY